jgi:glycine cleavage system transcriptional repressor
MMAAMDPSTHPSPTQQHMILSAVGADRPGLVDEVSEFIFERGGNMEDSRMANLRGQFTMMVLIGGSEVVMSKIRGDLPQLARNSRLHAELRAAGDAQASAASAGPARPFRLVMTVMDQAGLVHRISHVLRSLQVNIESLDTHLGAAPYTGAPIFEMELTLSVPQATAIAKLREQLGHLCDELNIDWELSTP